METEPEKSSQERQLRAFWKKSTSQDTIIVLVQSSYDLEEKYSQLLRERSRMNEKRFSQEFRLFPKSCFPNIKCSRKSDDLRSHYEDGI